MANNNNDTWKQILHIIITILTALATALTTQSCIKHRRQTDNLPIAQPTVKMTALASTSALSLMEQPAAYLLICYGRDTLAIPLKAAVLNHGISPGPATVKEDQFATTEGKPENTDIICHRPRDRL